MLHSCSYSTFERVSAHGIEEHAVIFPNLKAAVCYNEIILTICFELNKQQFFCTGFVLEVKTFEAVAI